MSDLTEALIRAHDAEVRLEAEEREHAKTTAIMEAACDRFEAAEARLAAVRAVLADEWREEPPTALYPEGRRLYRWPMDLRAELIAALTPTHPAPTSTGAGTARDTQAAGGEGGSS